VLRLRRRRAAGLGLGRREVVEGAVRAENGGGGHGSGQLGRAEQWKRKGRRRKRLLTCGPCAVSYKLAPHGREVVLSSDRY